MSKVKTAFRLLKKPGMFLYTLLSTLGSSGKLNWLSDKACLNLLFFSRFGRKLNWKNPETFNEKLNWLKIYDRKAEYNKLVDKFLVREYISGSIGEEYLIPLLGVWNRFDEIDFDSLPEQFVLKCTHDSGSVIICKDKKIFDYQAARKKIECSLKKNLYWRAREWVYKDLMPKIIAEQYMEDEKTSELRDYKFFCFDGEVKMLFVATERQKKNEEVKFDFFDVDYNRLPFKQGHPNAKVLPEKPQCFDEMKELAAKLSKGIPHVRVDFYEVNGKVYFGELTFFHFCGLVPFEPEEWDFKLGSWIELPMDNKE